MEQLYRTNSVELNSKTVEVLNGFNYQPEINDQGENLGYFIVHSET